MQTELPKVLRRFLNLHIEPMAYWQGGVFDFGDLAGGALADPPLLLQAAGTDLNASFSDDGVEHAVRG